MHAWASRCPRNNVKNNGGRQRGAWEDSAPTHGFARFLVCRSSEKVMGGNTRGQEPQAGWSYAQTSMCQYRHAKHEQPG